MRVLWLIFAALVASCGGDGGSQPVAPPPPEPPTAEGLIDLSVAQTTYGIDQAGVGGDGAGDGGVGGAAGDGSPLGRATVVLTDSTGKTATGQTDDKGGYLLRFKTAEFKAPFVVKVVDAGGNVLASATEIVVPVGKATRVNVNPLTDKIISDILPATTSGTDKVFDGASLNTGGLAEAKANLRTSIQGALVAANVPDSTQFDPVRAAYKYDGTGVDAIIESISHARNSVNGATQLQSKLAPLVTNEDGTVVPVLITASTPLATSQLALSTNPALTFTKINAWVNRWNTCLANGPTPGGNSGCSFSSFDALLGAGNTYKHNSKDFLEDFRTLCSEADQLCVAGSTFQNPNILFIGRFAGSTIDDLAVVEVTIRQPRTGPLAGNIATPIEYTKTLVFKRDDVTPGLTAGNWVLYGNQRAFDWTAEANYYSTIQTNPAKQANVAGSSPSAMYSGLRVSFSTTVFDVQTRAYKPNGVYAVRIKGPGLPAAGLVYAPHPTLGFRVHNKTGDIPAPGTVPAFTPRDFRMSGVVLGTSTPLASWGTSGSFADSPTAVDFSRLSAFSSYTAEIFTGTSTAPIVETTRILAPIQAPATMSRIPLHDLTASTALVTPPQPSAAAATVQWTRAAGSFRIESAFINFFSSGTRTLVGTSIPDAFSLAPSSTSVVISNGTAGIPASAVTDFREVGLEGRAARSYFLHSIQRQP